MQQLEMRFYSRSEIAEITNISLSAHNFSRDVKDILAKWGYGREWICRKGVTITHIPTSPEERLQEILIRQFHVDVQVDMYSFACFVTAFSDLEGFSNMPDGERQNAFYEYSGKYYDDKTFSNWRRKLLEQEIMVKGTIGSYWKTEIQNDRKIRSTVPKKEVDEYNKRRSELLDQLTLEYMRNNPKVKYSDAYKAAWKEVYPHLWAEFGCCYYSCKTFHFTAWNKQGDLAEVYELTREISGKEGKHA